jgi:hypothetical protein
MINGVNSPDKLAPFLNSLTTGFTISSISLEDLLTLLYRIKERQFKKIPDALQYHITIASGRLIKWCFENDIQTQTIDLHRYKKHISDVLNPLGIDCNYLFSYVINLKEEAIEETILGNKNYWPYDPHKLDSFYNKLCFYHFIDPSGHFKAMFLIENPPLEHRILWKKNLTDLIYLGYKLYYKDYQENYIEIIDRIFCKRDKKGQIVTIQRIRKTSRNIREQISEGELKGNWTSIFQIFKDIPLP